MIHFDPTSKSFKFAESPLYFDKVHIPWYNYRYFKSNKWTWAGNFCRYVLSKHKAFSCVFLDQESSDYGEEQHIAHLYRNPPELHSTISLELLTRHIPNILNIFKGLLCSGRTNSFSSLGHQCSFLEEDAQSNSTEKNHFLSPAWIHSLKEIPPQNHRDRKTHHIHQPSAYKLL